MATDEDLRRFPRISSNCMVEISISPEETPRLCEGRLTELSLGGGLLRLSEACPLGSQLSLRFWLPDLSDLVCKGIARSLREGHGVGVEFVDLSPQDLARLKSFLPRQS